MRPLNFNPEFRIASTAALTTRSPRSRQPFTHAVKRLQVELLGGLGRNELHGRALHSLGDRLCVEEVVLLSLRIRTHVLRRHPPCFVPKLLQLAAEMMRANAAFPIRHAGRLANRASN